MRIIHVSLTLIALAGTCPAGDESEKRKSPGNNPEIALPFEPWEFKETDGHLWLHFHRLADKDNALFRFQMPLSVQLAGVDTKFVPLVYFKGDEAARKKQMEINDTIADFVAGQLKGKTVWIEETSPGVFAGPRQVLGIVWFDADRKRSLQQLLVEKNLAVKQSSSPTEP